MSYGYTKEQLAEFEKENEKRHKWQEAKKRGAKIKWPFKSKGHKTHENNNQ